LVVVTTTSALVLAVPEGAVHVNFVMLVIATPVQLAPPTVTVVPASKPKP
jgi:hypothetical protein